MERKQHGARAARARALRREAAARAHAHAGPGDCQCEIVLLCGPSRVSPWYLNQLWCSVNDLIDATRRSGDARQR